MRRCRARPDRQNTGLGGKGWAGPVPAPRKGTKPETEPGTDLPRNRAARTSERTRTRLPFRRNSGPGKREMRPVSHEHGSRVAEFFGDCAVGDREGPGITPTHIPATSVGTAVRAGSVSASACTFRYAASSAAANLAANVRFPQYDPAHALPAFRVYFRRQRRTRTTPDVARAGNGR